MEFKAKILVLSLILSGLILMLLAGSIFSAVSIRSREAATPLIAGVNLDQAVKVVITDKDALTLIKGDEGWNMLYHGELLPTAPARVADFITSILETRRFARVSSDPGKFSDFSLAETDAKRVQIYASGDKLLVDLYLGKAAPGSGQYLRLAGANEVIQSDNLLYISTQAKDWMDGRLFSDDLHKKKITSIQINNTGFFPDLGKGPEDTAAAKTRNTPYAYTIVPSTSQDTPGWLIKERPDLTPSISKVESLVNTFIALEAEDVVIKSDEAVKSLQSPSGSIVVFTEDGLRYSLLIGGGGPDKDFRYFIQGSEKKYIYKLSEWNIMQVMKRPAELTEGLK